MNKAGKPRQSRLAIEPLEGRDVPAISASLHGSTLIIDGSNSDDSIIVRQQSNQLSIDGTTIRDQSRQVSSLDQTKVRQVVIRAQAGNDTINFASLAKPTSVWGGRGNDRIYCGSGNDVVYGDQGDDTIYASSGSDWLVGGDGNDRIWGGSGHDWVTGDSGDDVLCGEAGNDTLNGGDGRDTLNAGSGVDSLEGHGFGIGSIYAERNFDTFSDEFDLWRPIPLELSTATRLPNMRKGQLESTGFLAALGALSATDVKAAIRVVAKGVYDVHLRGDGKTTRVYFDGNYNDNDPKPTAGSNPGFALVLLSRARIMSFGINPNHYQSKNDWETWNARVGGRLYSAADAQRQFTGRGVSTITPYSADFSKLKNQLDLGSAIVAYSFRASSHMANSVAVVGDTNYVLQKLFVDNYGKRWVQLYNPLGDDVGDGRLMDNAPGAIRQNDGIVTMTWDDFRRWTNFTTLYIA